MTGSRVPLALALPGVVVLTAGTGGYLSPSADRSVEIAVADDEYALIEVDSVDRTLDNGNNQTVTLLELRNQIDDGPLAVSELSVTGEDDSRPPKVLDWSVASGATDATKRITAEVVCANNVENSEVYTVSANGNQFSVRLFRDVSIACTGTAGPNTTTATTAAG